MFRLIDEGYGPVQALLLLSSFRHTKPAQQPLLPTTNANMSLVPGGSALLNITQAAINVFLGSQQDDGLIGGLTYWQVANGYTAIALHDTWSNTSSYSGTLEELIGKVEVNNTNCINAMNDDSMWWAVCSLELFDLTAAQDHLTVAEAIWEHVNQFVIPQGKYVINGTDMGGGVIWSSRPNETQVNAVTAGLYAELSARLASQKTNETYREGLLASAINTFSWILRSRFDQDEYVVLDHIDLETGWGYDWTFTYNTGQAIAASVAIYNTLKARDLDLTQSATTEAYLDLACDMASYALNRSSWVDSNGTLTEPGAYPGTGPDKIPAWQDNDAVGFKAILLRSLAKLYKILVRDNSHAEMQTQLASFIQTQFQSLQLRDTNWQGQYGPWWDGPMDLPTSHSQLAALDVMAAIHAV
ncbi:uncharacterized protein Z520_00976 [Fonsecaea multimorphosa CBS 102226]|uniref:Glycoside hydrolase family 76 protein n=1 Tax=Fonsecaea multimorphosa CBS 102226 TaxID=1442371 RepID=A0A0D2HKV1_9EURO|nr:uncharacterized protein Z520_00976 [Fonsecaea multimorphosa CBS 102226]KIY02511.1 hypothetical protein Z520_00976 [Fonsecaea multimorphosa CBS 102226]OAL31378.1 hypothetical protein AYO22_00970 [Fonsecaea multimorphosa]